MGPGRPGDRRGERSPRASAVRAHTRAARGERAAPGLPEGALSSLPPGEPRPIPGRGIKPFASLLAHRRVALAAGTAIVLLGIPWAFLKGKSEWSTTATLLVSPRFAKNLESDQELELQSNTQYRDFVQQQIRTVNRIDVVERALERLGPKEPLWTLPGETRRRAAGRLQGSLAVFPVHDTYMFLVSLKGPKPDGLADVVNAVVDSYVEAAGEEEIWGAEQRIEELKAQREALLAEIRKKTERRAALGRELGTTTFAPGMDSNAWDKLLQEARAALDQAARRRLEAESKLLAVDAEADEEVSPPPPPASRDADAALHALSWGAVAADPALSALKQNLTRREADLLTTTSGMTADHPARAAAEKEAAEIAAEIARRTAEESARARARLVAERRAEAFEARRNEEGMAAMVEARRGEAQKVAEGYDEALSLTADLERARKRLDSIDNRIDFLLLESRAPGWVRVVTRATPPDLPSGGGKKKLLLLVLLAAAGAVVVLPVGIDLLDPRIRSANEAEKLLGFPPLGWLIERSGRTEAFAADQLLRMARKLVHERTTNGTRVFALTSSKPGEGTTTLALELARAVSSLGLRPVVLEANALRPSPLYGEGPGLAALLSGGGDPVPSILPSTGALPERMPAGTTERSLGTPEQLRELLGKLLASRDAVFLDLPPLLLSADAELFVPEAGMTLVVIEADALPKGIVKRTFRALERLAPPAVGAIVNRVRPLQGGGYFAEILDEHREGKRAEPSVWLSPWLWK